MKALLDLEDNDCRFPFGEDTIMFCGEAKQEKSSYCAFHHRKCWMKPISSPPKARVYHGTDFARGAA